jgi:hypothetical protein
MPCRALSAQLVPVVCLLLACNGGAIRGDGVNIEITPGLTPEYRWATGPGFSLGVARLTAPATVVWGIADPKAGLTPPILHGVTPRDVDTVSQLELRLTAGVRYRVTVALADGRTGSRDFTAMATASTP